MHQVGSTISTEIRNDHVWILHALRQIVRHGSLELAEIRRVTNVIGAHHLAEEETLYEPLKTLRHTSVGRAQQYHIILDDLTHSIELGRRRDRSTRSQILLLENLLEHHFYIEEQVLLPAFVGNFSAAHQLMFGEEYRHRFSKYANAPVEIGPTLPSGVSFIGGFRDTE